MTNRNSSFVIRSCLTFVILNSSFVILSSAHAEPDLSNIELPPGFSISLYAGDVPGARSMAFGPDGTLFVGTRNQGRVYALVDVDSDGKVDKTHIIARNLNSPNGVAVYNGDLYVAEISRILRYSNIGSRLENPPEPEVVYSDLPEDRAHGWKYLRMGPDEYLYFGIGAPCNICLSEDPRYATLCKVKPDGTDFQIIASGIRNTVGFDWHPATDVLWFTENGRDGMGDDIPPDELNRVMEKGQHFGYPFHHGAMPDPKFGDQRPSSEFVKPAIELGPHVAALGMRFCTGSMFPDKYRNQIFIAEHGSWDRSRKIGYRITLVRLDEESNAVSYDTFAQGWLRPNQTVTGRPVDLLILPDGSMLVSDDYAGAIYRIAYTSPQTAAPRPYT